MTQIIEFDINVFNEKVLICIATNFEKVKEYFLKSDFSLFDENHNVYAFNATHNDGKYRRVIYLKKWSLPIFIHEAYHVTKYILDDLGIEDHETGAYLIEYIYKETVKRRKNIKNS